MPGWSGASIGLTTRLERQLWRWPVPVDATERQGFSAHLDRFASLFSLAGERLRGLQSGKLYFYILEMFLWVLVMGILSVFVWL